MPIFVKAIEIRPLVGKLTYLLPVLLHGKSPDVDKVLLAGRFVVQQSQKLTPLQSCTKGCMIKLEEGEGAWLAGGDSHSNDQ